jgi:hypothetical protein
MLLRICLCSLLLCVAGQASARDAGSEAAPADFGKTVRAPESSIVRIQHLCERMLARQIHLRNEIVKLDKKIKSNDDAKPSRADEKTADGLADQQQESVRLADQVIEILTREQSAVAFTEVVRIVRDDMKSLEIRLRKTNVGNVTMAYDNDIIETLQDMVDALKKSPKEEKQRPKEAKPGGPDTPQAQKPLGAIQELKLIRAMQIHINRRIEMYSGASDDTDATTRQQELKNLDIRQATIRKLVQNIRLVTK